MIQIEVLSNRHNRKQFDCGNESLNRYLQQTARQHAEKGIARTFVLIDDATFSDILGFFTLMICDIQTDELPSQFAKKYPRIAPAAKLARLAVSKDCQRQGFGKLMMTEAMQRVINVSQHVGIIGFLVDAKNEDARCYYQQYGFIEFHNQSLKLFLPIKTLEKAFL
jgi:GNAT superfamily N-acetyltransferase